MEQPEYSGRPDCRAEVRSYCLALAPIEIYWLFIACAGYVVVTTGTAGARVAAAAPTPVQRESDDGRYNK
jgi:hypothetical protein